jgi:hypothetical protein
LTATRDVPHSGAAVLAEAVEDQDPDGGRA